MITIDTGRELNRACNGGGGCIMVDKIAGAFVIWDSKNPYGPRLVFTRKEYADFRRLVRDDTWPRAIVRLVTTVVRLATLALREISG
jgi:hypothetical protein